MAKVTVRMFATVREAAGQSESEIEADGLVQLMTELSRRHGKKLERLLSRAFDDPDRLVVLVNGKSVRVDKLRDAPLSDGDEVAIFPPVSGG